LVVRLQKCLALRETTFARTILTWVPRLTKTRPPQTPNTIQNGKSVKCSTFRNTAVLDDISVVEVLQHHFRDLHEDCVCPGHIGISVLSTHLHPVNQIDQLINQSNNRSIDWPINHLDKSQIIQSMNLSIYRLINYAISQWNK